MPWPLAGEIGGIGFAALMLLLVLGGGTLIEGIAGRLPKIHFLFIRIDLEAIFRKITLPIIAFFTAIATFHFTPIENWLRGIAHSLIQSIFGVVQTTAHHATQIEALHNVIIPASELAAITAAHAYTAIQLQAVRDQVHSASTTWANAHTWNDAQAYIKLEKTAPSVEHSILAGLATTLIATETHAQDLHDQLRDYIGRNITGQADVAAPYDGQTLTGVEGAIAIPWGTAIPSIDVQDLIKAGEKVAVGTAVAVIAEKIVSCLVSKCAGNNNFSQLLQDALGVLTAVEIGEFLSDVISNPAGVLVKYENELKGLVPATKHDAGSVLSAIESVIGV